MNWIDIVIVIIIAFSAFTSLRMGFLRQTLTLMGFVVGIYSALSYQEALAKALSSYIKNSSLAVIVAFVLILVAVWVAFAILASLARGALKAFGLAWTDNLFGMVVGLLAGLFVTVCLLLLFARISAFGISEAITQSTLAGLIFQILPHLQPLLPSDLRVFMVI